MSSDHIARGHLEGVYSLLDLLQIGFALIGPGGEVCHLSSQAQQMLGRRVDGPALRRMLGDLHDDLVGKVLAGGAWTTRWREHHLSARGAELEVSIRSVAIEDEGGRRCVLLAFYDVSVEIGLHRQYKELFARQEAINEELRRRIAEVLREHEDDHTQFSELLQIAPAIFASFVGEAETAVRAITALAAREELDDDDAVAAMRESHTLKGNARGLGLNFIAGRAHAVEELIARARRSGRLVPADLLAALDDLRRSIDRAISLRGGLERPDDTRAAAEGSAAALAEVGAAVAEALATLPPEHALRVKMQRARAALERMSEIPLAQLVHYLRATARTAAAGIQRDPPAVDVRIGDLAVPPRVHAALQSALPHLVRNAVIHGIGPGAERAAKGKPSAGMITVTAHLDGATLVVEVSDDGRGIDRASLEAALRATGRDPAPLSLEDLVFHPGLSSRAEVDLEAGRGMGALAARETLRAIGGTLAVTTEAGRGTTFTATVPLRS